MAPAPKPVPPLGADEARRQKPERTPFLWVDGDATRLHGPIYRPCDAGGGDRSVTVARASRPEVDYDASPKKGPPPASCLSARHHQIGLSPSVWRGNRLPQGMVKHPVACIDIPPEVDGSPISYPRGSVQQVHRDRRREAHDLFLAFLNGGKDPLAGPSRVVSQEILGQFDRLFDTDTA